MMLALSLLGGFGAWVGEEPLEPLATQKTRALLAYLALESRPQSRQHLRALLWSEAEDGAGLGNLRKESHPHGYLHACPTCLAGLEQASHLYGGALLASDANEEGTVQSG